MRNRLGSALREASGWHLRTDALSTLLAAFTIGAIAIRTGVGCIGRGCVQWPALPAWTTSRSTRES